MPKYLIQGSYTQQSWASMVQQPENRSDAARKLVENVGGKLECLYWAFGPDDVVAIAELPNDEAAGAVALAVAASGGLHGVRTTRLITMDEGAAMLRKAQQAASSYAKPGAAGVR